MSAIDRVRDRETTDEWGGKVPNPARSRNGGEGAAGRGLAIVGIVLGIAGIVLTVLLSVASIGATMLLVGLMTGGIGGVLLSPSVGRAAPRRVVA